MTSFRIRPRFRFSSSSSQEQIKQEMKEKLKSTHQSLSYSLAHGHVIINVKKEEKHYWSPQLSIEFEDLPDGSTLIRGIYGPHPNVWTLFAFLYSAVVFCLLFMGIYEGVQYSLKIMDSFSWNIPIIAAVGVLMYIVSQFGQKLGAEQTFALHHFLEDVLHSHIDIE